MTNHLVVAGYRTGSTHLSNKIAHQNGLTNLYEDYNIAVNHWTGVYGNTNKLGPLLKLQRQFEKGNCVVKIMLPTGWDLKDTGAPKKWLIEQLPKCEVHYLERDSVEVIKSLLAAEVLGNQPIFESRDSKDIDVSDVDKIIEFGRRIKQIPEQMNLMKEINPGRTVLASELFSEKLLNPGPYTHNYKLVNKLPGFEDKSLDFAIESILFS